MPVETVGADLADFFGCPAVLAGPQSLCFEVFDEVQRFTLTWNPRERDLYLSTLRLDGSPLSEVVALNVELRRTCPDVLEARSGRHLIEVRRKPRLAFKVSLL